MQLTSSQVTQFYRIWNSLLPFVNEKRKVISKKPKLWYAEDAVKVRDVLWADDRLLDAFVRENPAGLCPEDLAIADSWHSRVADTFFVVKQLKKYAIFMQGESPETGMDDVYGVVGISDSIENSLMFGIPGMIKAVLIPFEGKIIYDSLFISYPISFGKNIRGTLNRDYQRAKTLGLIRESLESQVNEVLDGSRNVVAFAPSGKSRTVKP